MPHAAMARTATGERNEFSPLPESRTPRWVCSPDKNPAVRFKRLRREPRQGCGLPEGQEGVINQAERHSKYHFIQLFIQVILAWMTGSLRC